MNASHRVVRARASAGQSFATMARVGLRMMFHDRLKMIGTLLGVVFAVFLSNLPESLSSWLLILRQD